MSEDFILNGLDNKVNQYQYNKTDKKTKADKLNSIIDAYNKVSNNHINNINTSNQPETKINPDGSGTRVTQKNDKQGNLIIEITTLGPGGKVLNKKQKINDKNGNFVSSSNTVYKYDKNGKLQSNTQIKQTRKEKFTTVNTFNSDGKISHTDKKVEIKNNGKTLTVISQADYHYTNGKLTSKETTGTDQSGNPVKYIDTYENDGKTLKSSSRSYYKRGALYKDYYDGENLANRTKGGLPTTRIIYEDDGKTVKETIKNNFDENGVLIGRAKYDKNGKLIDQKDFSKLDGKFDTAYQIGKGDCYLLASINALSQTEAGQKILQDNVKVSINDKGEKVYTITFPGAEKAREALINGTGEVNIGKLPADKVHIQGSYTITESELEEAAKRAGKDYSAGDKDVLLYEVAYERYREDVSQTIKDNKLDPNKTSYIAGLGISSRPGDDYLSGGNTSEATFILTGQQSDLYINRRQVPTCYVDSDMNMHITDNTGNITKENEKAMAVMVNNNGQTPIDEILNNLREDSQDGKIDNYAASAGFIVSSQEVNGQTINGGGHALNIVKVTDNEVFLANPWDPDTPISMTIEEFKKSAKSMSCIELNPPENSPAQSTNSQQQQIPSKLEALVSHFQPNSNQQSHPIRIPPKQNIMTIINQHFGNKKQNLSAEQINKIQEAIIQLNRNTIKSENGELYIEADTEINLPDLNDI